MRKLQKLTLKSKELYELMLYRSQKNLEFECYTRDKLIAQDEKNLKSFLKEQI